MIGHHLLGDAMLFVDVRGTIYKGYVRYTILALGTTTIDMHWDFL